MGKDELNLREDLGELGLVFGVEQPVAELRPDQEAGQAGEEVIEQARQRRVPDHQDDEMDLFIVRRFEGDAFLRQPHGDGDLAVRIHSGVGKGDTLADGRALETLAVDDPGEGELLVGDELLLDQDVKELFEGLDLVLGLEVEYDLGRFQVIRKMRAFMMARCLHLR